MKNKFFIFIILFIVLASCSKQVPEGTTIKIVDETGANASNLNIYKNKLAEKLEEFNFVVKRNGQTNYTIRITDYDYTSSTWDEWPWDDCSNSYYTLTKERTTIKVSLCEYSASVLKSWSFDKVDKEKLRKTKDETDDCYDYYVGTPIWVLFEGSINSFARRTARRTSRIVFKQ